MGNIDDSDIEKIAEQVNKKRKVYRWYNDAEKAKKIGPVADAACWILGLSLVVCLMIIGIQNDPNFSMVKTNDHEHEFVTLTIQTVSCQSLKDLSLKLQEKDIGSPAYSSLRSNIDSQILARC